MPTRRSQFFEVVVFILLITPGMALSYFAVKQSGASFIFTAAGTILHNVAFLCLIAFFAWKNGEAPARFGWVSDHAEKEFFLGLLLFFLMTFAGSVAEHMLSAVGIKVPQQALPPFLTPRSHAAYGLAFFLVIIVAISEETIFRGYLILRFSTVAGSRIAGVLLSTLFFSLGHGYEGYFGLVAVFFIGLIFALVYVWRGSLIAPMVMHFLQDFMGIFIAPWLSG